MSGGTGAEQCGARAEPSFRFEVQVCLSVAMSGGTGGNFGKDWCGATWRAGSSFRGKSVFVGGTKEQPKLASRGKSASQLDAIGQLSNGTTKPASRGKSAWQLNCKYLDVKVQRKFQGKRRVLDSQARTASCQTNSGNKPRKGAPIVRA